MNDELTFNQRMRQARNNAGMSLSDAMTEVRMRMPRPMWVTDATIGRLEIDRPEAKADPFLLAVLASVYGVNLSDLSKEAAQHLNTMLDLLKQTSPCITNNLTAAL